MIYAFLFQEHKIPIKFMNSPTAIWLGGHNIANMNAVADWLTGFKQSDEDVNKSTFLVYPGQEQCKLQQGHSIWHETSANGLLDLVWLCDFVSGSYHY